MARIRKTKPVGMRERMPTERPGLNSVSPLDLTAREYRNLLDLARLAISHPTTHAIFSAWAPCQQDSLTFDFVTLGLYDSSTGGIRLDTWNVGHAQKRSESVPVDSCASGWAWKNQRSVLIQDLEAEPKLPVFLEFLCQLGVRTYYVFPLTTIRHKLGAIGFGSLHVIPKTSGMLELLRQAAAMLAQFLDTTPSSEGTGAHADYVHAMSTVMPGSEAAEDFDLSDPVSQEDEGFYEIVGNSAPLKELLSQIRSVAATDATVLLLGETGTGKELVARAIHRFSPRADAEFVSVNCTAIPAELLESELFGHERGAFTGAIDRHIGRWELADKGTLLLDEVGDLPTTIQPKLLRVLQEKEFERLGSTRTLKVDVRLIAATNQDLRRRVAEGRFREDLFYRLNVFPIYVPSLRERKSDIPALVRHFVSTFASEAKKSIVTIPAEAMDALLNWRWPGNIRELQNLIHRCVILTNSSVLKVPLTELRRNTKPSLGKKSQEVERELILQALKEAGGVIGGASGAANRLGMKRTTFYSKMKKLNIGPAESKD
jgi:formate hydrogenlyase transcriptional activator